MRAFGAQMLYRLAMDTVLCDISAFRLHRTPPQVAAILPSLASAAASRQRLAFASHPTTREIIGTPVHRLVFDRSQRGGGGNRNFRDHLWDLEKHPIATQAHPIGCDLTSPLYTLLLLAQHASFEHLLMAMYEMCGTFAVFHPSDTIEAELARSRSGQGVDDPSNWERVVNRNGLPTDLWRRAPLVEVEELKGFAESIDGLPGHRAFAVASKHVTGVADSPFEVQASMLLGLPRRLGGEGFKGLENNKRIPLTGRASDLALRKTCFADLYFGANGRVAPLDIECHGRGVHDGERASISDADRATALESMGINVVQLTYGQIHDPARFAGVKQLVADYRGTDLAVKGAALQKKESQLRQQVFVDWNTLCA